MKCNPDEFLITPLDLVHSIGSALPVRMSKPPTGACPNTKYVMLLVTLFGGCFSDLYLELKRYQLNMNITFLEFKNWPSYWHRTVKTMVRLNRSMRTGPRSSEGRSWLFERGEFPRMNGEMKVLVSIHCNVIYTMYCSAMQDCHLWATNQALGL